MMDSKLEDKIKYYHIILNSVQNDCKSARMKKFIKQVHYKVLTNPVNVKYNLKN